MALIKKFKIKNFIDNENIVEIKNASVFYNKRQILKLKDKKYLEC